MIIGGKLFFSTRYFLYNPLNLVFIVSFTNVIRTVGTQSSGRHSIRCLLFLSRVSSELVALNRGFIVSFTDVIRIGRNQSRGQHSIGVSLFPSRMSSELSARNCVFILSLTKCHQNCSALNRVFIVSFTNIISTQSVGNCFFHEYHQNWRHSIGRKLFLSRMSSELSALNRGFIVSFANIIRIVRHSIGCSLFRSRISSLLAALNRLETVSFANIIRTGGTQSGVHCFFHECHQNYRHSIGRSLILSRILSELWNLVGTWLSYDYFFQECHEKLNNVDNICLCVFTENVIITIISIWYVLICLLFLKISDTLRHWYQFFVCLSSFLGAIFKTTEKLDFLMGCFNCLLYKELLLLLSMNIFQLVYFHVNLLPPPNALRHPTALLLPSISSSQVYQYFQASLWGIKKRISDNQSENWRKELWVLKIWTMQSGPWSIPTSTLKSSQYIWRHLDQI